MVLRNADEAASSKNTGDSVKPSIFRRVLLWGGLALLFAVLILIAFGLLANTYVKPLRYHSSIKPMIPAEEIFTPMEIPRQYNQNKLKILKHNTESDLCGE